MVHGDGWTLNESACASDVAIKFDFNTLLYKILHSPACGKSLLQFLHTGRSSGFYGLLSAFILESDNSDIGAELKILWKIGPSIRESEASFSLRRGR